MARRRRKGEPSKVDRLTKRQTKRVQGPDRRTRFSIFVTLHFRANPTQRNRAVPTIIPVTDWGSETAIRIQLLCPGGNTTDFGFHSICADNFVNHCNERVNLVIKCPDYPNRYGILKLNRWVKPRTPIQLNSQTEIGEIECSGFEPVEGHNTLEFIDLFTVNSDVDYNKGLNIPMGEEGDNKGLKIPLGEKVDVNVMDKNGQTITLRAIAGIVVEYIRVV